MKLTRKQKKIKKLKRKLQKSIGCDGRICIQCGFCKRFEEDTPIISTDDSWGTDDDLPF